MTRSFPTISPTATARESVLHTLAEMIEWADRWTTSRPPAAAPGAP
jgi:hypothetical protein